MEKDLVCLLEAHTRKILDQINNLEFPENWTPKQVVDYITYKIDRN
jgi:hypothetical protein